MKKELSRIIAIIISAVIVFLSLPVTAGADMGPKPSVRISFKNMGERLCYGTLLSKYESTGPRSAWDGSEENAQYKENGLWENNGFLDYEIWKAFLEYEDADGYYFLQIGWKVSESKEISWMYYPPQSFKILLYYPETETFVVSGIYERYAFDTYYTVDMKNTDIETVGSGVQIRAYRSYNYTDELISLLARIFITIAIEMAIAVLFGFIKKKQLIVLVSLNVITQILLNVLLNIVNYNSGSLAFAVNYFLLEIFVFVFEAIFCCTVLKKVSDKSKNNWYYVLYAFAANAVSFIVGFIIAQVLPGIF